MGSKQYTVERIGDRYTVVRKDKTLFGMRERFINARLYKRNEDAFMWFGSSFSKRDWFNFERNTFDNENEANAALSVCVRLQA